MTIFTHPQWCIEPLRPHGNAAVWLRRKGCVHGGPPADDTA